MPLVKPTLEMGIKSALETEFKSAATKQSLRSKLDGDSAAGSLSSAKTISKALGNIKLGTQAIAATPADQLSPALAEATVKKVTANEWANAISECISEWMASDIAPIIAKTIADQVDTYIKSATIIVPPGQVVATAGSPAAQTGATTAPSPPATIA
jgi:hypothetical protein